MKKRIGLLTAEVGGKESFFWMLSGFWAGVIWGLSSIPGGSIPKPRFDFPFAAAAHFTLYFILSGFLHSAMLESRRSMPRFKRSAFVLVVCLFYGVIDEIHQSFVPGRFPSVYDVFLDGAGALSYLLLVWAKEKRDEISAGTSFPI